MKALRKYLAGAAAAVFASAIATVAMAETVIIYTDESPNAGGRAVATKWLFDEIEKRTGGEVRVDAHWGGALMKNAAVPEGVGSGAADMGVVIAFYNPSLNHTLTLGDIPTEYDIWVSARALYDVATTHPDMQKEYDKLNLKFLANLTSGPIQLVCKDTEISSIADMKGKKIRGTSLYGKIAESLGAINVSMAVYDVYQALDTGIIDCTMNYNYAVRAMKHDEIATSLTLLNWGTLGGLAYVMNKDTYESLSEENRKIIDELSSEFVDFYVKSIMEADAKAIEDIKANAGGSNVKLIEFPADEKAQLLKASESYYDSWREEANRQGYDGAGLLAAYREALKKYGAERQAKGLPWERQ